MSGHDRKDNTGRRGSTSHDAHVRTGAASQIAPGKRTLVESLAQPLSPAPVQRKEASDAANPSNAAPDVHAAAALGTAGSAHHMPHADSIQRLFGRHDISGIQAHTDASAAAGAQAMGAKAFATGNHVAFASMPDLHTAAHEAAHVVQQRAGVHLSGGVDQVGDPYEQHADAVADRVVAGKSAEALLDRGALEEAEEEESGEVDEGVQEPSSGGGSGGGAAAVQRSRGAGATVQRGRSKRSRKKKAPTNSPYASCEFDATSGTTHVKRVVFFARPPSNSRGGQGDHIVAYALIQDAIARAVAKKPINGAATALAALITDSKPFVKKGAMNSWWHSGADSILDRLGSIDPTKDGARADIRWAVNETAKLLNMMPGSTVRNAKSSGGQGEAGAHGGLQHLESKVAAGKTIDGNPWNNVLGLIDLKADPTLRSDVNKLEHKLNWLITLFTHAAPTVVSLLKAKDHTLMPGTDLGAAVTRKIGVGLPALTVNTRIETFLGI